MIGQSIIQRSWCFQHQLKVQIFAPPTTAEGKQGRCGWSQKATASGIHIHNTWWLLTTSFGAAACWQQSDCMPLLRLLIYARMSSFPFYRFGHRPNDTTGRVHVLLSVYAFTSSQSRHWKACSHGHDIFSTLLQHFHNFGVIDHAKKFISTAAFDWSRFWRKLWMVICRFCQNFTHSRNVENN